MKLLIHEISKHSRTFNGGHPSFDQEDRIGSISLDLEVIGYELVLDYLNFSSQLPRYNKSKWFNICLKYI